MYFIILIALAIVACLTPMILAHTSVEIKLLALQVSIAAIVHMLWFVAIPCLKKDNIIANRVSTHYLSGYTIFSLLIMMLSTLPKVNSDIHGVIIASLGIGLILNNFYLVKGGKLLHFSLSAFYAFPVAYLTARGAVIYLDHVEIFYPVIIYFVLAFIVTLGITERLSKKIGMR